MMKFKMYWKAILCFILGAAVLPMWTVWALASNLGLNISSQKALLIGLFTIAFIAAFSLHKPLYVRLVNEDKRHFIKSALMFVWLYMAWCGVMLIGKVLVD